MTIRHLGYQSWSRPADLASLDGSVDILLSACPTGQCLTEILGRGQWPFQQQGSFIQACSPPGAFFASTRALHAFVPELVGPTLRLARAGVMGCPGFGSYQRILASQAPSRGTRMSRASTSKSGRLRRGGRVAAALILCELCLQSFWAATSFLQSPGLAKQAPPRTGLQVSASGSHDLGMVR